MGKDGNLGSLDFGELNVFISSEKGHEGGDVLHLSKRCCSKKKLMSYPIANSIIEAKLPFHQKIPSRATKFHHMYDLCLSFRQGATPMMMISITMILIIIIGLAPPPKTETLRVQGAFPMVKVGLNIKIPS